MASSHAIVAIFVIVTATTTTARANDPDAVRGLTGDLDALDAKLDQGKLEHIWIEASSAYQWFDAKNYPDLRSDPSFARLRTRFQQLAIKAARIAGGKSIQIVGDGTPVAKDADKQESFKRIFDACDAAASTPTTGTSMDLKRLSDAYGKYERELGRVLESDPTVLRVQAMHWKLVQCEFVVASLRMEMEDTPTLEDHESEKFTACGYSEYTLQRLGIGGGTWGPWQLLGIPTSNGFALACTKHPKRSNLPAGMKAVMRDEFNLDKGDIVVTNGPASVDKQDGTTTQQQDIRIYSRTTTLTTSGCGDKDPNVVCEASGSKTARAYNALTHLLARAELHRTEHRSDRCKKLYGEAREAASRWMEFYDEAHKRADWRKGLTYKTKTDGLLTEGKIVAKVKQLGELAEQRSVGGYCTF